MKNVQPRRQYVGVVLIADISYSPKFCCVNPPDLVYSTVDYGIMHNEKLAPSS